MLGTGYIHGYTIGNPVPNRGVRRIDHSGEPPKCDWAGLFPMLGRNLERLKWEVTGKIGDWIGLKDGLRYFTKGKVGFNQKKCDWSMKKWELIGISLVNNWISPAKIRIRCTVVQWDWTKKMWVLTNTLSFTKDVASKGVFFRVNLAISKAKKIPKFATLLILGFF